MTINNKIRLSILGLLLLTLAAISGTVALTAQTTTQGSIAGTVLDSSGAVVPGATVNILNKGTGFTVNLVSDGSGYFKAPLLEPGSYAVTITSPNFAKYTADNVVVVVGQVTTVEPRLAVASSTAEVVVTEQVPDINLESPDLTDTLNNTALQSIPINNRRWSSLAMTTPGAVSDSTGYGYVSIRGIAYTQNNVEIDGADDNNMFYAEERGRTREAYSTAGAAVREFAVNTGVYSAEYGRAAGGVINSVTQSGTNKLHGQAYFWDRESNWAAYNDYSTIQNASGATVPFKGEDLRKIYGFTAGGPLIKDKLFWIYTYDQHTHVFPAVGTTYNVPIFNAMPSLPSGVTVSSKNPVTPTGESCSLSGSTLGELVNTGTTTAYTGTPGSLNDADVCVLAARQGVSYNQAAYDWTVLMLGNSVTTVPAGVSAITDLGLSSDLGVTPRFGYQEINMPKLDWQINPKEHVSFLYNRLRWDSPGGVQTSQTVKDAIDYVGNDFVKVDYGVAKLTSLIAPTVSNEVLYQYSRELLNETNLKPSPYSLADLTGPSSTPQVEDSYYDGFSAGSAYYGYEKALPYENKWQVGDTLYWTKGNHSFKFGADLLHTYDMENNLKYIEGNFSYNYFGGFFNDLLDFKNGVTPSGSGYGSKGCNSSAYETGTGATGTYPCYYSYSQGFGTPNFAISTMDYGFFGQDNWKIEPRLTLELGLRWDYEALPPPISNLLTAATQNGVNFVPYTMTNGDQPLLNTPSDKRNFGPRVGFSWDVFGSGKSVLRGGWGMYFGRIINGDIMTVRTSTGSPYGQVAATWKAKTAGAPRYPSIEASNSNALPDSSYFFAPNLRDPEVQEFDLALQQAVGKGTLFQLSYIGALGRELPNFLNLNLNPATMVTDTVTISDASGLGPIPNGTTYQVPVYLYGATNSGYANGNPALFGAFGADYTSITEMISNVNSSYNGLVVEIMNRTLKSIQFDANYTWSHSLDFAQNASTGGGVNDWYDPFSNPHINYGNGIDNVPNRFVAYAIYNLPNLHTQSIVKYLSNGWNVDTSFQMQNGLPFTAGASNDWTNALSTGWNGSGGSSIIPLLGTNNQQYPRKIVDDMRVQKEIAFERGCFGDNCNLQLMLNVFNVANHQNVDGYSTTSAYYLSGYTAYYQGQTGPSAGTNTGYKVPDSSNNSSFLYTPREVEISARFNF